MFSFFQTRKKKELYLCIPSGNIGFSLESSNGYEINLFDDRLLLKNTISHPLYNFKDSCFLTFTFVLLFLVYELPIS